MLWHVHPTSYTHICAQKQRLNTPPRWHPHIIHTYVCAHKHRLYTHTQRAFPNHTDIYAHTDTHRDIHMHTHSTLTSYTHTYVCTHRLYIYTHTASNTNMCACKLTVYTRSLTHTHTMSFRNTLKKGRGLG